MAKIVVENARVERVFHTQSGSTGVALVETFTPRDGGGARRSWFTAWFKQDPGLEVGQVVSVSGFHSVKVRTYEAPSGSKTVADVSVNSARLIDAAPLIDPEPEPADPWGSDGAW